MLRILQQGRPERKTIMNKPKLIQHRSINQQFLFINIYVAFFSILWLSILSIKG